MENFILTSIIWILAIYGLIEIIKTIIYLTSTISIKQNGTYMIIAVKNQENTIEYFIRNLLFRILYGKEETIKNIIVADLDSEDATMQILKKLEKDYDCISVKNWRECKQIIDDWNGQKQNINKKDLQN